MSPLKMLLFFLQSLLSSAILIFSLLPPGYAQLASSPIVNLGYATYQGTFNSTSNTTDFLGIRYAAPPIGESLSLSRLQPDKLTLVYVNRKSAIPSPCTARKHIWDPACRYAATRVSAR